MMVAQWVKTYDIMGRYVFVTSGTFKCYRIRSHLLLEGKTRNKLKFFILRRGQIVMKANICENRMALHHSTLSLSQSQAQTLSLSPILSSNLRIQIYLAI